MIDAELADVEHLAIRPAGDLRVEFLLLGRIHGSSEQVFHRMDSS